MILLPAEVLTPSGWKKIYNIKKDKICCFNSTNNTFYFDIPLSVYLQPLFFSSILIKKNNTSFTLDSGHNTSCIDFIGCINNNFKTNENNYASIKYEDCIQFVIKTFNIDTSIYHPLMQGTKDVSDFASASHIQIMSTLAGQHCELVCNFSGNTCILNDTHHPEKGEVGFCQPEIAANICTTSGNYLVRICNSTIGCSYYSTFII